MWPPTSELHDVVMNSSAWYIHQPIDHQTRALLSDRQLTERATWLAALRAERGTHRR
jgi:hypothetical protein